YVLALNATNYHVTNCPNSDYSDRPWYPIAMCCIDRGTNPAILSFYWRVACASNPTRKAWLDIYDGNWHTRVDSLKSEYTGWQRVLVDLSSYANSRITLRIRSSILDGYVYLDQMQVYETGIEEHFVQPSRNGLCLEVRPNLTFGNTKIYYVLPRDGEVKLSIYNLTGEIVRLLIRERQRVGDKKVLWDGKDAYGSIVPAGIYFCILEFEGRKAMQKLIKLR
ncbi:MAG TPA: T9SS type A sorting domain-containing protein, partial [bacterium (Candidatus Stahlbacteria)]|nr:T9SS type A sorting domain-containing protein [Candidatus Stahlbacteria bacterium]